MNCEGSTLTGVRWGETTLLGRLSEGPRRELLGLGTTVRFEAGRTLIRQGEFGRTAYLLHRGCVKIRGNEADWEPLLAVRVGGDLVGEMSVLSCQPRSATVLTCADTTAKAIPADVLRAFLLRSPEVSLAIAAMLGERLRWSNERRLDVAAHDPRGRLSRVLITLAEAYGRSVAGGWELGVPLTQAELAALAGIKLPTAEKALRSFAEAGLLRLGYRSILLRDVAALRDITRRDPAATVH